MSDKENEINNNKHSEIEIESILEETHYPADQEKMDDTIDGSDEDVITPEQAEAAMRKTAMLISLLLDGFDEDALTTEQSEADLKKTAEDKAENEEPAEKQQSEDEGDDAEENEYVTLTPEYDDDTEIAGDIINEVEQFRDDNSHIQSTE